MLHSFKPEPKGIKINDSLIHGKGVFTTTSRYKGENIGITHIVTPKELSVENNLFRSTIGGRINHSKKPNCGLVKHIKTVRVLDIMENIAMIPYTYYTLVTIVNIKKGEELTLDYSVTPCGDEDKYPGEVCFKDNI